VFADVPQWKRLSCAISITVLHEAEYRKRHQFQDDVAGVSCIDFLNSRVAMTGKFPECCRLLHISFVVPTAGP
jgi:hypothetical protein